MCLIFRVGESGEGKFIGSNEVNVILAQRMEQIYTRRFTVSIAVFNWSIGSA